MSNPTPASPDPYEWEREGHLTFSLRDGFVWASWPESEASVRLGRHDMVAAMMQDFLAQDALGVELAKAHLRQARQTSPRR